MESPPLLLLLLLLPISFPVSTVAAFTPTTNYLLSCGSSSTSSVPSDPRTFQPDNTFSLPNSQSISSNSSNSSLYSTARQFQSPSSYYFPISVPSTLHFLRLHFFPFPSSSPFHFSVFASSLPLLTNFTPSPQLSIIEFLINVTLPTLTLSFSPLPHSLAFVNAIELFSAPPNLFDSLPSPALSTAYRLNVGGNKVTPQSDLLWRNWDVDQGTGKKISSSTKINYQDSGTSTREIAPDAVYGSARVVNLNSSSTERFNMSWILPVSSGRMYLVRMHFCDIVSPTSSSQFTFSVYINDQIVLSDYDLSSESLTTAYPHYKNFNVNAVSLTQMSVSVGPTGSSGRPTVNAILNGLEVMAVIEGTLVLDNPPGSKKSVGVLIGCIIAGILIAIVVAIAIMALRRKKKRRNQLLGPEPGLERTPRRSTPGSSPLLASTFSLNTVFTAGTTDSPAANLNLGLKIPLIDIQAATNNFDQSYQIGSGGFGKVYKGLLSDGTGVAVKRATPGSGQGLTEFQTEILMLSKIRHRHLVSLIGYCDEQGEMILVYEFMEKGTLRDHLNSSSAEDFPSWKQRLEICIGAARGLHYLHTGDAQAIIHRDVKSSNILLDGNYLAKVADFGLSKQGPRVNQTHVSTVVKGSFGYFDPEYYKTQQLTEKSDVYSFGVVLLEVACARPAIDQSLPYEQVNLADWGMIWLKKGRLEQIVDPRIRGSVSAGSLRKFGQTVERCLAACGVNRPPMADVVWNLEYALQLQETTVRREPHEDSMSSPSEIPMVNIRRLPSSNVKGFPSSNGAVDESSEWGDSQVFSHLMSGEGR